jgi:hypothetical protein
VVVIAVEVAVGSKSAHSTEPGTYESPRCSMVVAIDA